MGAWLGQNFGHRTLKIKRNKNLLAEDVAGVVAYTEPRDSFISSLHNQSITLTSWLIEYERDLHLENSKA